MGKILQIDLTGETFEEYPFTDRQREETIGGKGLAYRILADHLTGREEAFSAENQIILSTGPLTGTGAPGSDRFEITAISPKTRIPVSSNCGGSFGVFLKKAGYDAVILRGRCRASRWLEITENGIQFHDSFSLWGMGTEDCYQQLAKELPGVPFGYLCIGPAGEDLLSGATVISDGRTAGRAGFGAVLGWKNLKAITVSGNQSIRFHDQQAFSAEMRNWIHTIKENPLTADPQKISSCPGCPIRCKGKEKAQNAVLNNLGLDALDAAQYSQWLQRKLGYFPEHVFHQNHRKRRDHLYHSLLESYSLADSEAMLLFYQNLSEAISSSGLCIFTISTCIPAVLSNNKSIRGFDFSCLLHHCTGLSVSTESVLSIARNSGQLQEILHSRFLAACADFPTES